MMKAAAKFAWLPLLAGPLAGVVLGGWLASWEGMPSAAGWMAGVALWMCVWWITACVPMGATALLPVVLFPLAGIESANETAARYMNATIMLFLGGFLIARAAERVELHRRLSWWIVGRLGASPRRLVLAFMLAAMGLSMWISNTATAIMMVAIAIALLDSLQTEATPSRARHDLARALLIGIAYSCSLGGLASLIGTPTNLVLISLGQEQFPELPLTFAKWMLLGLPVSSGLFVLLWVLLCWLFFPRLREVELTDSLAAAEDSTQGPLTGAQWRVALVFGSTCLLWIFRKDIALGSLTIPGWSQLHPALMQAHDGMVAIAMALLLFALPQGKTNPGQRLLQEADFKGLPWGIVLLFGGGFALAHGFSASGLAPQLVESFRGLAGTPDWVIVASTSLGMTFLTELTSNTASAAMTLPILSAMGEALGLHPFALLLPATLAASLAFMMPVATPPNAIVFASGRLQIRDMIKVGFWFNLIAVGWMLLVSSWLIPWLWPVG